MTIKIIKSTLRVLPDGRVSADDAARYLGFTSKTLANWRFMGLGPRWLKSGKAKGCRVWYRVNDLDAWLHDNVTETAHSREAGRNAVATAIFGNPSDQHFLKA